MLKKWLAGFGVITTLMATTSMASKTGETNVESTTVKVGSCICFPKGGYLEDDDGNAVHISSGEQIHIVWMNDGKYRAYVPKANMVLYYTAEPTNPGEEIKVVDEEGGLILGDLNRDSQVDVFDLVLMRRIMVEGTGDTHLYYMSDFNGDNTVSIADLVKFQKWLLGCC